MRRGSCLRQWAWILVLPSAAIYIFASVGTFDLSGGLWPFAVNVTELADVQVTSTFPSSEYVLESSSQSPSRLAVSTASPTQEPSASSVGSFAAAETDEVNFQDVATGSPGKSWYQSSTEHKVGPRVAAVIAAHPPRFYYVARFLEHWSACPSAVESLSVSVIFTGQQDLRLFLEAQQQLSPNVPRSRWTPVVCTLPAKVARSHNQHQAAWKKWYGIAHLLDLDNADFAYGLMLDSELELYDTHACRSGGEWMRLFARLRRAELSKAFPAARVGQSLVSYNFRGTVLDGKAYDTRLIKENADFALTNSPSLHACQSPGCAEIRKQIEQCLFSWWTDLPYLNLTVARQMLAKIGRESPTKSSGWRKVAEHIRFPRFEYIAYQQWCCMHEGFHFKDVTRITGEAKWGSYIEDPQPGARIYELEPLWISSETLVRSEQGIIPKMSKKAPPLLVFHLDHDAHRFGIFPDKHTWEQTLLKILKKHGRSDWNTQTIQ